MLKESGKLTTVTLMMVKMTLEISLKFHKSVMNFECVRIMVYLDLLLVYQN